MQLDSSNTSASANHHALIAGFGSKRVSLDGFDEFGPLGRALCERAATPLALARFLRDQGRGLVGYVPSEDLL
jgi:hypothetical protein